MQNNIMTYYYATNILDEEKVVARSYETSRGWIFDEGSRFETKDPVTNLHNFFVIRHSLCQSRADLKYEIAKLKKRYDIMRLEQVNYK